MPPPASSIAPLIFRWARSLSSSHPTSKSGLAQTTYPLTLPCHCSIHHQHRIYFNCQKMHLLKHLVSSSTIFFWIFILGHIKLLIKVMTRILKVLSKGMQLRLATMLFMKLMTSEMERTLTWIPMRALFRVGISWAKISLWRPRNFVSFSILYCIPHDSLAFLCSGKSSISDYDLDILHPFAMKIRNNLTASTFHEILYNFSKAGMESLAKMQSHVRALSHFAPMKFAC